MMFVEPPLHPRRSRARSKRRRSAPPAALTLVAAEYDAATLVRLTFDRPIDIAGIVASAIVVSDGPYEAARFAGTGAAELSAPATVELPLELTGPASGPIVTLTASALNGIVAVDDGGTWAGVADVELPFG